MIAFPHLCHRFYSSAPGSPLASVSRLFPETRRQGCLRSQGEFSLFQGVAHCDMNDSSRFCFAVRARKAAIQRSRYSCFICSVGCAVTPPMETLLFVVSRSRPSNPRHCSSSVFPSCSISHSSSCLSLTRANLNCRLVVLRSLNSLMKFTTRPRPRSDPGFISSSCTRPRRREIWLLLTGNDSFGFDAVTLNFSAAAVTHCSNR